MTKSTRKRSSCAISILEWAGGTVLGERSWGGRNDYRRKILAKPSAVHSSLGQTRPGLTFMGKDSWAPSCFCRQIILAFFVLSAESFENYVTYQWDTDVNRTVTDFMILRIMLIILAM